MRVSIAKGRMHNRLSLHLIRSLQMYLTASTASLKASARPASPRWPCIEADRGREYFYFAIILRCLTRTIVLWRRKVGTLESLTYLLSRQGQPLPAHGRPVSNAAVHLGQEDWPASGPILAFSASYSALLSWCTGILSARHSLVMVRVTKPMLSLGWPWRPRLRGS